VIAEASAGPLAGRVAVVTGGSRGMGRALPLDLARRDTACVFTYRQNAALASEVAAEIERLGPRALALAVELAEPERVVRVFEKIRAEFGRLDILVANAAATACRLWGQVIRRVRFRASR